MRLLHTSDFKLQEFIDDNTPEYAILSHTWGADEVLFEDITKSREVLSSSRFDKIRNACAQAKLDECHYIRIDTCCINRDSSSELSEAINSMFKWYRAAKVCYAILTDVLGAGVSFSRSRWFKRGWTLQELLAPRSLMFYDQDWCFIGERKDLRGEISAATAIRLTHLDTWQVASVAQRMSWMTNRQTTRQEDIAYCLLGFFDVNMPLLYGEGKTKAFLRLQNEIVKNSHDESIFAWTDSSLWSSGLLAHSPANFLHSGDVVEDLMMDEDGEPSLRPPYLSTNLGLQIELEVMYESSKNRVFEASFDSRPVKCRPPVETQDFFAQLACRKASGRGPLWLAFKVLQGNVDFKGPGSVKVAMRTQVAEFMSRPPEFVNHWRTRESFYFQDIRHAKSAQPRKMQTHFSWRPSREQRALSISFRLQPGVPPAMKLLEDLLQQKPSPRFEAKSNNSIAPKSAGTEISALCLRGRGNESLIVFSWQPEMGGLAIRYARAKEVPEFLDFAKADFARGATQRLMIGLRLVDNRESNRFSLFPLVCGNTFSAFFGPGQFIWISAERGENLEERDDWLVDIDVTTVLTSD